MSRIGKNPITIPQGVTVDLQDGVVTVKGKLGELKQEVLDIDVKIEDGVITFERSSDHKDLIKGKTQLSNCLPMTNNW